MERFARANPTLSRDGKTSSMYSTASTSTAGTRTTGYRNSSADSSSSRPTSTYTPSYMNAIPARKPVSPRPPQSNGHPDSTHPTDPSHPPSTPTRRTASTTARKGTLLIFIADTIHPSTMPYLETMLRRGAYANIGVVGSTPREKELKNLKIQIYALLGKLSHSSVGVDVWARDAWTEESIAGVVEETLKVYGAGEPVNGVLCQPVYGGEETGDVMALSPAELRLPWERSVGFLHAVAKAAMPQMRTSAGLFAVTGPVGPLAMSPIATFYRSACESLIDLLAEDAATRGVAIVHAENVLVPEVEVEGPRQQRKQEQQQTLPQRAKVNGSGNGIHIPPRNGTEPYDDGQGFVPSESPTKLWGLWSQLGAD